MIGYSRTGERNLALFKDQAKLISVIMRAKALAIQTYTEQNAPCGYGVHIERVSNQRTYVLFRDLNADCSASDRRYTPVSGEDFETYQLDTSLRFSGTGPEDLNDILFLPPDPTVVLTPPVDTGAIVIQSTDGSTANIRVNSAGQVSAQ